MGGLSSERDQSLRTGDAVHAALVERGYDAVKVFVDSRPRPGAAGRARRRRLPGAARPLRRGRLRPGAARAVRDSLHRLVGAGVGAGDGQAQGQGAVPPAQPADAALLRARARRGRAGRAARLVRFPVGGQAARRGLVARRAPRRRGRRAGGAVEEALRFDDHVLVERFIEGTEVHVARARRAAARRRRGRSRGAALRLSPRATSGGDAAVRAAAAVAGAAARRADAGAARAARARVHAGCARSNLVVASAATSTCWRSTRCRRWRRTRCCRRSRTRPGCRSRTWSRRCCTRRGCTRRGARRGRGACGSTSAAQRARSAGAADGAALAMRTRASARARRRWPRPAAAAWGVSLWQCLHPPLPPAMRAALARALGVDEAAVSVGDARLTWPARLDVREVATGEWAAARIAVDVDPWAALGGVRRIARVRADGVATELGTVGEAEASWLHGHARVALRRVVATLPPEHWLGGLGLSVGEIGLETEGGALQAAGVRRRDARRRRRAGRRGDARARRRLAGSRRAAGRDGDGARRRATAWRRRRGSRSWRSASWRRRARHTSAARRRRAARFSLDVDGDGRACARRGSTSTTSRSTCRRWRARRSAACAPASTAKLAGKAARSSRAWLGRAASARRAWSSTAAWRRAAPSTSRRRCRSCRAPICCRRCRARWCRTSTASSSTATSAAACRRRATPRTPPRCGSTSTASTAAARAPTPPLADVAVAVARRRAGAGAHTRRGRARAAVPKNPSWRAIDSLAADGGARVPRRRGRALLRA